MADRIGKPVSQRQLRVGEMIKQSLSMIFMRNEAKVPNLETKLKDCLIISPTLSCLWDTGFPIRSAIKLTSQ